jgi:hypothetical protein
MVVERTRQPSEKLHQDSSLLGSVCVCTMYVIGDILLITKSCIDLNPCNGGSSSQDNQSNNRSSVCITHLLISLIGRYGKFGLGDYNIF